MEIIAHRGASGLAPENTLAAFQLAWEVRADGIEMDVHLSRDGRVVVHHDADTRRSAGVDLLIADTASSELRKLDVGRSHGLRHAGQTMPFLEEVLATVPAGKRVLIEVKSNAGIVPALQAALAGADLTRMRLDLISFDIETLAACRRALRLPSYPVFEYDAMQSPAHWIELAGRLGFSGLDPEHHCLDAEFAHQARRAGLELLTWTVNDLSQLRRLHALGVAAITTDWPREMRQVRDALELV